MKYRPEDRQGDFDTKTRKVERVPREGHKVKVTIMFRGREVYHPELGKKILDQVAEQRGARSAKVEVVAQARRPQHDRWCSRPTSEAQAAEASAQAAKDETPPRTARADDAAG